MYRLTAVQKQQIARVLRTHAAQVGERGRDHDASAAEDLAEHIEGAHSVVFITGESHVRPSFLMPVLGDVLDPRD